MLIFLLAIPTLLVLSGFGGPVLNDYGFDATGRYTPPIWSGLVVVLGAAFAAVWRVRRWLALPLLAIPLAVNGAAFASVDPVASFQSPYWDKLPVDDALYHELWNEISGRDGFDEGLKTEDRTKDALFVVRQRLEPTPGSSPIIRQVFVYAVTGSDGDVFTGNFDGVMVAAAPMPMPITLKGSLRLYHVEGPPVTAAPRGILARFLDIFRGCHR